MSPPLPASCYSASSLAGRCGSPVSWWARGLFFRSSVCLPDARGGNPQPRSLFPGATQPRRARYQLDPLPLPDLAGRAALVSRRGIACVRDLPCHPGHTCACRSDVLHPERPFLGRAAGRGRCRRFGAASSAHDRGVDVVEPAARGVRLARIRPAKAPAALQRAQGDRGSARLQPPKHPYGESRGWWTGSSKRQGWSAAMRPGVAELSRSISSGGTSRPSPTPRGWRL
jgi:hypothetical protein